MKTREHISVTTMYPPRGKGRGFYILSPSISSLLFFFLPFVSDAFQMEGDGNSCTRSLRPRARPPSCRLILPISIIYEDTIGCMCSLVALSLQQFFPFFFFPPYLPLRGSEWPCHIAGCHPYTTFLQVLLPFPILFPPCAPITTGWTEKAEASVGVFDCFLPFFSRRL